ncbi:MAG: 3-deoxy-manno-octulosonate cytidylyltransferase [Bdellovibrionales bacterium]
MPSHRPAPSRPVIIIPSRMASTRLPGKPLADINGLPMIARVLKQAEASKVGPVIVACDDAQVKAAVEKAGGKAVLTKPDHPSGSDRIWEALNALEGNEAYDAVVNVQGDEPMLDPATIRAAWELLRNPETDIATLVDEFHDEQRKALPSMVKVALDVPPDAAKVGGKGRALYFSRQIIPSGDGPIFHHIGLYAYRRDALAKFVAAPPSPLERREKLEQLRALSLGLRIDAAIVAEAHAGIDTPEDLERVRKALTRQIKGKQSR